MEAEKLQQFKYIYNIYISSGLFHCERFPIVYLNSDYVYFKRNGRQLLDYQKTENIRKQYSISELEFLNSKNSFNRFYLDVSDFLIEEANDFLAKRENNNSIKQAEIEFRLSEERYLDKKSKYEKLLSRQDEAENK